MKRIFSHKNRHRDEEDWLSDEKIRLQINSAMKDCRLEKDNQLKMIDDYKEHAKDLIFDIFQVPEIFWYEELNAYEKIKGHEKNLSISPEISGKTDVLIEQYRIRIQLCESKIDVCIQLLKEFENLLIQLDEAKVQIQKAELEEKQNSVINKHIEYIQKEDNPEYDSGKITENGNKLEQLKDEIHRINEEFRIKQRVTSYMKKLETDLNLQTGEIDFSSIKEMIEKIKNTPI
jgi:hypothetical protein